MKKKLLFIQYRRAGKVMNGGDQATKRNYDMLCKMLGKENVDVYHIHNEENKSPFYAYIIGAVYMLFGYFFGLTPKRISRIVQLAQTYDYVFIDRSVFGVIAKELRQNSFKGKIITHFHNIEKRYFNDKMPKHLPFRSILIRCADMNDALACWYSDELVVLNDRDSNQLQALYGVSVRNIIPISLPDKAADMEVTKEVTSQRLKCLFLGSYFTPNNEGIIWFLRNVHPKVEVEVKIVGRGMGKLKEEHPDLLRDIEVVNDAPDLTPYLEWADVMVLPIFAGSGMKVKTCESLMYGKNIIATDEALEGYAIEEGKSAWRCNTPEEFVQTIQDFIQHPRPKYNEAARQCFLENYSNDAVERKFKELLRDR